MPKFLIGILFAALFCSCYQNKFDWTTESNTAKQVSWNGSWDNSKKLKLLYHGVKIYNDKSNCEWAFKTKITYPKNYDDDTCGTYAKKMRLWTPPSNAVLCMPITKITYIIYDIDNFLIDSMSVKGDCIKYKDTLTLQFKKKIPKDLIAKFKYGKINIEAGFINEKN